MAKWEMARLGDVCDGESSNIAQKDLEQNEGEYPIYGASGLIKYVDFYKQDSEYIAVVKDGSGIGRTTILPAKSSVIGTMQSLLPKKNVDAKYLYYATSAMNLAKYYTGATIPHIYFKDYKKEVLPLPPLPVQRQIADVLDRASALIEKRKAQIDKLDLLIKSQFIEMFGDPVTNPMGWEIISLSDIITHANNGMSRRGNDNNGDIVLRLVELQEGFIDYGKPNRIRLNNAEKERYLLSEGDFLFARVNGNPNNVGRCAAFSDIGEPVFHNDHIIRVRFNRDILNNTYASELLNNSYGKNEMKDKIKTSAGQYTINQTGIGAIKIPLPPLPLQNRFADFVRQADKSKFAMQQSHAKLELTYKSLMQKCFRGEIF